MYDIVILLDALCVVFAATSSSLGLVQIGLAVLALCCLVQLLSLRVKLGVAMRGIATCDATIARVGGDPSFAPDVAVALLEKGRLSREVGGGGCDQAMAIYDEVVNRFSDATTPELRVLAAVALLDKANTLDIWLARRDDAASVYEDRTYTAAAPATSPPRTQVGGRRRPRRTA